MLGAQRAEFLGCIGMSAGEPDRIRAVCPMAEKDSPLGGVRGIEQPTCLFEDRKGVRVACAPHQQIAALGQRVVAQLPL